MQRWLAIIITLWACNNDRDTQIDPVAGPTLKTMEENETIAPKVQVVTKQCGTCETKNICRRKCGSGPVIYKGCCDCPSGSVNTAGNLCPQF